jgi:signal transduction histidine kinase
MRRWNVRVLLAVDLAAAAAAVVAVAIAAAMAIRAVRPLDGRTLVAIALAAAAGFVGLAAVLLGRAVAAPVERLLSTAARLGAGQEGLPLLGPEGDGGPGLSRAAVAFERLAAALADERARLAAKVEELERANRALVEARETALRSERLATVGRLAAGVAHEVGNPLGAIGGWAELARDRLRGGASSQADEFVARIPEEVRRIDRIVRDLLDFARPQPPTLAPVPVAAVVEAALRLARVQARFRGIDVALRYPEDLPDVLGDEHRLAQVFLNLLLNAGDAMGGEGPLEVRARRAGEHVEIEVADRGPGIPAADLARVFDPFFTTKAPGQGTGLGLSVCVGLLETLGGDIAAENAPGGGAVFRVRLRAAGAAGPGRAAPGPC